MALGVVDVVACDLGLGRWQRHATQSCRQSSHIGLQSSESSSNLGDGSRESANGTAEVAHTTTTFLFAHFGVFTMSSSRGGIIRRHALARAQRTDIAERGDEVFFAGFDDRRGQSLSQHADTTASSAHLAVVEVAAFAKSRMVQRIHGGWAHHA